MRIFQWKNKRVTSADLFLRIEESEIKDIDAIFPEASEACTHFDNAYFAFVDTTKKLFIPMRNPSYAFGGMYNGYPPYGDEMTDTVIDMKELTWEAEAEIDKVQD